MVDAGAPGDEGEAPDGPEPSTSLYGASPHPENRVSVRRLPRVIGRAFRLVWQAARRELLICIALQAFSGLGVALQLLLGRSVIDKVVGSDGQQNLTGVAPSLIGLAIVTALVGFSAAALVEHQRILAELVECHVQGQIIDVVSAVELEAFESAGFHDRLRRAKINASDRSWQAAFGLVSLLSGVISLAALGAVLTTIEPLVLPVVLVGYLPLWAATSRNGRASYQFAFDMTAADRERVYLQDVLAGKTEAKELRLFGASSFLRRRYDTLYACRMAELRQVAQLRMRRSLLANGGSTAVTLLGVGVLLQLALTGRITAADAGVAAIAVQQLGARLRGIDSGAGSLHECSLFLDDLVTFLDLRAAVTIERPRGPAPSSFSRLEVHEVTFSYPGTNRSVLQDVSIEISRDEVVALVGRNGSGKTTLAKILCGLYTPSSGRVLWDGADVGECDPTLLRRAVTAIFQDFVHYELSARDNVGLGDSCRIDDLRAVHEAARKAGVEGLLAGLPDGYATRLSRAFEGGAELSIGQWQRIALARAFFRDAPFLVLDEPTASLDAESEYELFESIRSLQRGRAVLLISHRFSTVRSADRIYVLEHGRVVEAGTHDDLVDRRGRYAELFALQAAAYMPGHERSESG